MAGYCSEAPQLTPIGGYRRYASSIHPGQETKRNSAIQASKLSLHDVDFSFHTESAECTHVFLAFQNPKPVVSLQVFFGCKRSTPLLEYNSQLHCKITIDRTDQYKEYVWWCVHVHSHVASKTCTTAGTYVRILYSGPPRHTHCSARGKTFTLDSTPWTNLQLVDKFIIAALPSPLKRGHAWNPCSIWHTVLQL